MKGILMPENWNPGNEVQQKVEVPISRALKIIRSLGNGQQITTSNDYLFLSSRRNSKSSYHHRSNELAIFISMKIF